MLHIIRVYTVCKGKNIFRQNKTIFFYLYPELDNCTMDYPKFIYQTKRKNPLVYKGVIRLEKMDTPSKIFTTSHREKKYKQRKFRTVGKEMQRDLKHAKWKLLYDWRESCLLIGPICLHKSLCLPGNWSTPVYKLILHENQLELVSRS